MLASPLCSSASLVYFWVLFSPLFLFQYLFCWMSCSFPLPAPTHPEHELRSSFMSLSWPWNRVLHAQLLNTKWVKEFRDWASNHLEKISLLQGNLPDPGIKPVPLTSLALARGSLPLVPPVWVRSRFSWVRLFATLWTPGFSVHGILQARVLEWAPIFFSRKITLLVLCFPGISPFFTSQKSPSYTQACFLVYNCYHS